MPIVTDSILPVLILQLDVIQRTIVYKGITRTVPDNYWRDEVVLRMYPLWDTDKDKLMIFTWYSNSTYHAQRRKFIKNFATNEYEWKDYEMEQMDNDEAAKLFEFLKDTFYLIDSLENKEFHDELARVYSQTNKVNWVTIRLARNFLLEESDWIFSPDVNIDENYKQLWIKYRQALRDLPITVENDSIDAIKFPINPKMYNDFYILSHPNVEYLSTSEQFVALAGHYLTTFREKMVNYLLVKDVSEQLYYQSFIGYMQSNTASYNNMSGILNNSFVTEDEQLTNYLEELITLVENNDERLEQAYQNFREINQSEIQND